MDFATDDNSYRSAQVAATFTSLLQVQLAQETNIEWVERTQLDKARQEQEFSVAGLLSGGSAIQRGKWVKANWMITGNFSLDDRSQRTLVLELIDLQHADVLAGKTITFPDATPSQFEVKTNQLGVAAEALHQLLADAQVRHQQMAEKCLVAPLFLAYVPASNSFGFFGETGGFEQGFQDALERSITTNSRVQLIHFPKAYRSTEESEMVLDGMVQADRSAWQQTADLYVWGTYSSIGKWTPRKPPEQQWQITLHLWDGASPPTVLNEELPGNATEGQVAASLERLANQVSIHAHRKTRETDEVDALRKGIAQSLVKTYDQMTLSFRRREELGLDDPVRFLQAVHMLETACFFDPDSPEARLLYITCRWGWWMDFGFKVKNEFWSKWRRSQAWGKYADRFGLKAVEVQLPFPYEQRGICEVYLNSLDESLKMFPQWHSAEEMALEDPWRQQGTHTWLMEAEFHGFPKEMPHDLAMKWKTEVEAERDKRLAKVVESISEGWTPPEKIPSPVLSTVVAFLLDGHQPPAERLAALEKIWPAAAREAQKNGKQWVMGAGQLATDREESLKDLCNQAGQPDKAEKLLAKLSPSQAGVTGQPPATATKPAGTSSVKPARPTNASILVPAPSWLKDFMPTFSMFGLQPPSALPLEVKPTVREVHFPGQFEVRSVIQMGFLRNSLLILAMDEKSRQSSDANPEVSAELLDKHNRLWILEPTATTPVLYESEIFSESVRAFLLKGEELWVAGMTTGFLDLETRKFRRFGLPDGFGMPTSDALGCAGGRVFVAGDMFKVSMFEPAANAWTNLALPPGTRSGGTGSPYLLVGNNALLCYVAGTATLRDVLQNRWTNGLDLNAIQHLEADDTGFWFGCRDGLHFYDPATKHSRNWTSPAAIPAAINSFSGSPYLGNSEVPQQELEKLDGRVRGALKSLEKGRVQAHAARLEKKLLPDPLHLDWRIPGEVTALANDGDFLWLGIGNYFGNYLLLFNKPSDSLVGYSPMQVRDKISSLAVSRESVWVGTAYGDHHLLELSKDSFLSVPRNHWVSVAISEEDRSRLLKGMSVRDQAMYAFYAGDDSRVVELLNGVDPAKALLEQMFLLAFSFSASGVDKPESARAWFEHISSRYPDSPWSKAAQEALSANEQAHKAKAREAALLAKYDKNHDGVLDDNEKAQMEKDPAYQREKDAFDAEELRDQIPAIIKKFDRDNNGKLDASELEPLRSHVMVFVDAPPEMLSRRKILVAPLISRRFPPVPALLKKYDANGDGCIDADELKKLANDLQRDR
jgi:Ca2+-binding EF-hand superfamily protein